jgi:hypothetical protein
LKFVFMDPSKHFPVTLTLRADTALPRLRSLARSLQRRTELHRAMGRRVQQLTRDHLVEFSARHPNRVGGRRSYYWFAAALDVARPDHLRADGRAAVLSLTTPGITRALGPVYITPRTPSVEYLAMPACPVAYGFRAGWLPWLVPMIRRGSAVGLIEGENRTRQRTTVHGKKGETYFAEKPGGLVWYWFSQSVLQPQDRTLLPSDAELQSAAREGAAAVFDAIIAGHIK